MVVVGLFRNVILTLLYIVVGMTVSLMIGSLVIVNPGLGACTFPGKAGGALGCGWPPKRLSAFPNIL